MKLKFLFIAILVLLVTGCAAQVLAVPQAIIGGTVNVITAVGDALIFWD
tara:strand:+ start:743 stop:889 length:147 start_codon:yes stop_codon:yes gene_type:complete